MIIGSRKAPPGRPADPRQMLLAFERRRIVYRISDVEAWLTARTYRHRADELAHAPAE